MIGDRLRFEYVMYPLWRRRVPGWIAPLRDAVMRRYFPVDVDREPPQSPAAMAQYMTDWGIVRDLPATELAQMIDTSTPQIDIAGSNATVQQHDGSPVHIPAQWEPAETILISWGIIYPPLWDMHAQMAEAISKVAKVEILVPGINWAQAIHAYLELRDRALLKNVCFIVLPTNDIWIRDYGPVIGKTADGTRVALNAIYDVLPQYPQQLDNSMPVRWAAHHNIPVQPLPLHTEGGNLWSDGAGTLIMSSQLMYSNRFYSRDELERLLHRHIAFEKLIITPRLTLEETGHVDLLVKLASADTVLVSDATSRSTSQALKKTARIFKHETNAAGQKYNVLTLPTPPLYFNWVTYSIRRAYTNALTINDTVLVPVFGIAEDEQALRTYEQAMPGFDIVPIDSSKGINGGGAVHCMTKEVPL